MIDTEAFSERAAIMEYDAGLTRFEAETLAAKAQGVTRAEAVFAERVGNPATSGNRGQAMAGQQRPHNLPAVQRQPEEEE